MIPNEVIYVGGPFDGHRHPLNHAVEKLPAVTRHPINSSLLEFMFHGGRQAEVRGDATSIAEYRLRLIGGRLRYQHSTSVSVATGHRTHQREAIDRGRHFR